MNIRLIVNAFLIILAIHLLLENLNFHISIGDTAELFTNYLSNDQDQPDDYDPKEELMAYIENNPVHRILNRNEVVKPGNYYTSDEGNPTAGSNVMDVRKFYQHNPNEHSKGDVEQPVDQMADQMGSKPAFLEEEKPVNIDQWRYKGELPMNGGAVMGGIHGYNDMESQFATLGDHGLVIGNCQKKSPDDDIRMGMGVPNMQNRLTGGNM